MRSPVGLSGAELVLETLSPRDKSRQKLPFYARLGVREIWLVHPHTRQFEIYALDDRAYTVVTGNRSPLLGITLEVVDGPRLRLVDGEIGVEL